MKNGALSQGPSALNRAPVRPGERAEAGHVTRPQIRRRDRAKIDSLVACPHDACHRGSDAQIHCSLKHGVLIQKGHRDAQLVDRVPHRCHRAVFFDTPEENHGPSTARASLLVLAGAARESRLQRQRWQDSATDRRRKRCTGRLVR